MNVDRCLKYSKKAAVAVPILLACSGAEANDFTAKKVMDKMSGDERVAYVTGVIEGLAAARYNKDGKTPAGMNCIYGWYYDDKQTLRTIYTAFDRHPDYPPGSIIDVLARQKCGE